MVRAATGFRLVGRANAGSVVRFDAIEPPGAQPIFWRQGRAGSMQRRFWGTPAFKLLGHFVFLVLRRDA
ncbi:MAG: hypothetical protein WDO73_23780 [Ignavibacteriota bacterium]